MNIPEAIEKQSELLTLLSEVGFNKYLASTRLGIEALKRIKARRDLKTGWELPLLLGETEEVEQ